MGSGIEISPAHGLNPSFGVCFFCGNEDGTIVIPGRLRKKDENGRVVDADAEAPRRGCWSKAPCPNCRALMRDGVILISVKNGEEQAESQDPYRTGGWCVVRDDAIKRMLKVPALIEHVLKARMAFVPDEAWDKLGLPRNDESKPKPEMVTVGKYLPECPKGRPISIMDEFARKLGFDAEHFHTDSYLWFDGDHLLVSNMIAREPGKGAFRRFVTRCQEHAVPLRVPTALERMEKILAAWGWTQSPVVQTSEDAVAGEMVFVWDPPKEGPWCPPKEK